MGMLGDPSVPDVGLYLGGAAALSFSCSERKIGRGHNSLLPASSVVGPTPSHRRPLDPTGAGADPSPK